MVLESEDGIEVVGEAEDGEEAIARPRSSRPTSCSWTCACRGVSGIEATRAIAEAVPTAKILMLTVSDEEDDLYEAIKAGATGYLLKEISIEEVADAIRAVVSGQSLISPSMASKLLTEFNEPGQQAEREAGGARPPAHRPGARGAQAGRPGHEQPGDRRRALHLREHREEPRAQHPREAPPALPHGGRGLRRAGEAPRHPVAALRPPVHSDASHGFFDKILRAGEGKKLKALQALVPDINALEPEMEALSDDALQAKTAEFRDRLDNGEDLDDLLIEAFAVVREAGRPGASASATTTCS